MSLKKAMVLLVLCAVVLSCSPLRRDLTKSLQQTEERFQEHTGFLLYDLDKKKTVVNYNANKFFTPASNTKILTLFTSLTILGDSLPALQYIESGDSLIFQGMGDPSFLYKKVYQNERVINFLRGHPKQLYFSTNNFHIAPFGSGWAWDDYNSSYSAERSPFPIYGNCFYVYPFADHTYVWPRYFSRHYREGAATEKTKVVRDYHSNNFRVHLGTAVRRQEFVIPFRIEQDLISTLLADTLRRTVTPVSRILPAGKNTLYSVPVDSALKVMMQESDNLIAEQLLMMCAAVLSDTLQPEIAIKKLEQNLLKEIADELVWVDGSGLSRYNLVTPRAMVAVWEKLYNLVPRERLFPLLAIGGKPGTLKNWYISDTPYVFGKTGTLSNNHSLSGYLVTKSGKTMIFSFMNANYTVPTNEVRKSMETIINKIYNNY